MSTKLQISITSKEKELLSQKAALLGYDVTKFVKFLISSEAFGQLREKERVQGLIRQAMKEDAKGKTTKMSTMDEVEKYLDSIV